jgi:hypothetical protein
MIIPHSKLPWCTLGGAHCQCILFPCLVSPTLIGCGADLSRRPPSPPHPTWSCNAVVATTHGCCACRLTLLLVLILLSTSSTCKNRHHQLIICQCESFVVSGVATLIAGLLLDGAAGAYNHFNHFNHFTQAAPVSGRKGPLSNSKIRYNCWLRQSKDSPREKGIAWHSKSRPYMESRSNSRPHEFFILTFLVFLVRLS